MYNLIVGAIDGTLAPDRLLEAVEDGLEEFVGTRAAPNISRLMTLPTLLMPEIGDTRSPQTASIGKIEGMYRSGRDYRFHFSRSNSIQPIPSEQIQAAAPSLHIGDWDLSRARWSVKSSDLYQTILDDNLLGIPRPTAFDISMSRPNPGSIAVMMPFDASFNPTWDILKSVAVEGGWTCQRADDIWEDSVVINDVVSLITRCEVVVCDLTGRNANVFYEAGIAHTLGREVVLIAQAEGDIPFDLRHHRYVKYLPNTEGLGKLKATLLPRLQKIMSR